MAGSIVVAFAGDDFEYSFFQPKDKAIFFVNSARPPTG